MNITMYQKQYLLIVLISIFISGCATQKNLIKQGSINQEIFSKDNIKISSLHVYMVDEKTIITGNIRRKWGYRVPVWGHVDIAWYSPEHELLGMQGTTYLPQHLSKVGASSKFKLEIPAELEVGSIVKAAFHSSPLEEWPTGACQNNKTFDKRKNT